MPALKKVGPMLSKEPPKSVPAEALVQLNQCYSEVMLAQERHAHAMTKVALLEAAAKAQMLSAQNSVRDFFAQKEAAQARYRDLTKSMQNDHNLTDKHAIDPLTGVVVLPGG